MSDDDKTRISTNITYAGVGTQLSAIYELDERIASGGMGEVYRGHNIQTGDQVAIKIVLPEFARDQTILSLFRKEASILNHLSHDAVVRYHVFTIDPGIGRPYLAMEFVDGPSLFDIFRLGAMPPQDVRRLCHRLASGLSAVHQAGAIHRDLSPDNIILPGSRVERAKIIDFGIARSATVGGETLIGGKFAGKYNYVSPEQLGLYGGEVSEQSDIYSLGLVLAAALRGKPLDMSGSQYEVIEKRRTVPDLSDIDPDFRDLIEAMLQPDPRDRPASMAEIARATRDDDADATSPPASFGARERSGLPHAGWTAPPGARPPSLPPLGEQRFVQHVRPAHLSEPAPAAAAASPPTPTTPPKPTRMPVIASGAITLAVLATAGLYVSGVLAPSPPVEKAAPLTPKPAVEAPPAVQPEKVANNNQTQGPQPAEAQPTQPSTENSPTTAPVPKTAESQKPALPASEPPAADAPQPNRAETESKPSPDTKPIETKPGVPNPVDVLPKANASSSPSAKSQEPAQSTPPPKEPEAAGPTAQQLETANTPTQSPPQPPAAKQPGNTDVAINLPKPEVPSAKKADETAQRASWVRDFSGGDCFYASLTSATDNAAAIEGFGTAVRPFEQMLGDFRSRFHIEPDIGVRLISQPQCEVTSFLHFFDRSSAERPQLVLDRTSVPDDTPIGGTLVTRGGLVSNVMLIDHKGIAFNLDDRMVAQTDKAAFSIPIGLGAADKAAGKAVPQIMLVITGPRDIRAAVFSRPTPASELLPKILEEIGADGSQFSATAKYFQLGG
ncbi:MULTISPECIES: serine/threonine-protein kinase [Phyllobacteriaceae]|jgi:serine/threonine protein kinase|uniref:Serine/threonine protein kinase n=1 Tax=Mesorhizobium hungaricum TaxID=1566387 RepID=A0A1C2DW98_9HYPH|nr:MULTISPECIES: serine/threonine-protein kinase [Mesorhizobium]MBN9233896.1 protein kinase [Mesorhizobium sp.]MDQ0331425.1 serine/threonine-protein kinase [Mesorhizobium sp. YL-MeA3-2017]OCX18926.1 serine/threonine protein kinase [Mesorhizobium hungaricum]